MKAGTPAIHVRAPSSREPRRYLDAPAFSACTVPVVFYQHNPFNFAHGAPCSRARRQRRRRCASGTLVGQQLLTDHPLPCSTGTHAASPTWPHFTHARPPVPRRPHGAVLRDNAARMHSALRETPWADHARLTLMTGEGLAVSGMALALWQPLSRMRVDSWAEFGVRLPDGQASGQGFRAV